jgi:two-component system sensor histidine kinase KdpD
MSRVKEIQRPDPEFLLRQVQAEEEFAGHGRLKVFLGYASGVGKSFRMIDEGRRRRERGQDVIVGAIQPSNDPETASLLAKLEVIPLKLLDSAPVMDMEAILLRRPQAVIVDGLAYDNPPGSQNAKRWQDVEQLRAAGISILGSVNLQYIEELKEQVEKITGKSVSQTIPVAFLKTADEIVIVDAPPEMCLQHSSEQTRAGDPGLEGRLSELREIALLLAADVVDQQLEAYLRRSGLELHWGAQERILVCLTPRANAARMIQSGRRNADRFHGDLHTVYVSQPEIGADDQAMLERNLALAREASAQIHMLTGNDPVEAIVNFAQSHGITQIFIGHSLRKSWRSRLFGSPVDRLIEAADGIDVRVFPH